jgi:hypothetical protein
MPLIETAVAFVAAMLAASLFVSALVQMIQNGLHYRGRTVVAMLETLLDGFLVYHNDSDALLANQPVDTPDTVAARGRIKQRLNAFVNDVLSDPALHAREVKLQYDDDPEKLAELIEYIHGDDLIGLAHNYAESWPPGKRSADAAPVPAQVEQAAFAPNTLQQVAGRDNRWLPVEWVGAPPAGDDRGKAFATTANFAAYVSRWFPTIEATHSQQFKRRIRRLTIGISCLVVVLFSLDGLQLMRTLYHSRTGADAIAKQVDTLQATAGRLGVAGAPAGPDHDVATQDLALELQKTATILDDAQIGIGWQNSWITRRWCEFKGVCSDGTTPPSLRRLLLDVLVWLFGMAFSCVMLSLGAPFWVTTLGWVIRFQNEVQGRKQEPPNPGVGGGSVP